jgi:hypothetical protein
MLNTNFIITLLTILATLFCLFQGEIKEGFLNDPIIRPNSSKGGCSVGNYQTMSPDVLGNEPLDGLVKKPHFGPWTAYTQFAAVPYDKKYDPITGERLRPTKTKLGYDDPEIKTRKNVKETFVNTSDRGNSGVMIEAARNMQPMGPPPRFMVTGPKLNLYSPVNPQHAVDTQNPIVNYGCNDVYSSSGQMQQGSCQKQNIKEDYQEQVLPSDMITNSCTDGGNVSLSGRPQQPVMVDRLMWSSIKSRYQRGGVDRFRGDLLIVPTPYRKDGITNWFQTSVYPSVDLAASYISQHNQTGKENDEKTAALGIQCNMMPDSRGNAFGGGNAPPQGAYSRGINVTFGTDVSADVGEGVM